MATNTVISYPIPPYQNVPIRPEFYIPQRFVISGVTRGEVTTVTTALDHNYVIGQEVRILIPPSFGIRQLNERKAFVISIPAANQVIIDIDSNYMDAFIASNATTKPEILAIGDVNNGYISLTGRVIPRPFIPGSFINIS